MGVRLWHDDVRPAPEGWVWARTNDEAMAILRKGDVVECSLDHDLGLHHVQAPDPDVDFEGWLNAVSGRGHGAENGLGLVERMLDEDLVPAKVTIHSWNPPGAQAMAARLNKFGHDVTVAPFEILAR